MYHRLAAEVPPHDERISPFLGHCALMRHLRPAAVNIGIDLDEQALELWRGFAWESPESRDKRQELTLLKADGIEWLKARFLLDRWPPPAAATPAEAFAALYCGSRASRPEAAAAAAASQSGTAGSSGLLSLDSGLRRIPFAFVDPPYPVETLSSSCPYEHGLTTERHEELLRVVKRLPALVMIVSYPNALYERELADWRTFRYRAFTRRGEREEQAWCNYPRPLVLHDWRYAGRNRREREKIARRVRNWRRMFGELPPPERAAILDALVSEEHAKGRCESIYAGVCSRCRTVRPRDVVACPVCSHLASEPAARQVFGKEVHAKALRRKGGKRAEAMAEAE